MGWGQVIRWIFSEGLSALLFFFLYIGSEVFNGYNYGLKCIYKFIKLQLLLKYVVVFLPFLIKSFIPNVISILFLLNQCCIF